MKRKFRDPIFTVAVDLNLVCLKLAVLAARLSIRIPTVVCTPLINLVLDNLGSYGCTPAHCAFLITYCVTPDAKTEMEDPSAATTASTPHTEAKEDTKTEEEMEVPERRIGAIIGSGGAEVMNIERQSGAKVQMPKRDEVAAGKARIKLSGARDDIDKAKSMIQAIIDAPAQERPRGSSVYSGPPANLAGHQFANKDELWEHCHKLVADTEDETELQGEHAFFAFALLANHPGCIEKYGCGLKAIRYGVNKKFPDTKVRQVLILGMLFVSVCAFEINRTTPMLA